MSMSAALAIAQKRVPRCTKSRKSAENSAKNSQCKHLRINFRLHEGCGELS